MSAFRFFRRGGKIIRMKLSTGFKLDPIYEKANIVSKTAEHAKKIGRAIKQGFDVRTTWFHGTNANFKKFDMNKFRTGSGGVSEGYGAYFAKDPDMANGYASIKKGGANLHKVFLKKGNYVTENSKPFSGKQLVELMKGSGKEGVEIGLSNYDENRQKALKKVLDAFKRFNPPDQMAMIQNEFYRGDMNAMGRKLKKLGYVGIDVPSKNKIVGQGHENAVKVAFHNSSIRSVHSSFKVKPRFHKK